MPLRWLAAWAKTRIKGGLSSGEGLINEVRDPVEKWNVKEHAAEIVDAGVEDKRLLVMEPEFANTLAVMERPGNTLSCVIRNAWDGGILETMTANSKRLATDAHISIVGHITEDELRARLTRTDAANGFGNRYLFFCVQRSKLLPFGGNLDPSDIGSLGRLLRESAEFARTVGRFRMTPAARNLWVVIYERLSAEQDGLLGAVTARAEAQTILDIVHQVMAAAGGFDINDISNEKGFRHALERRCPDMVSIADWQQGVIDARCFLRTWERQARGLGWTTADLFGLHEPRRNPGLTYRRLGRYDATGLIWLLRDRPVIALTTESAAIAPAGGGVVWFGRKARTLGGVCFR